MALRLTPRGTPRAGSPISRRASPGGRSVYEYAGGSPGGRPVQVYEYGSGVLAGVPNTILPYRAASPGGSPVFEIAGDSPGGFNKVRRRSGGRAPRLASPRRRVSPRRGAPLRALDQSSQRYNIRTSPRRGARPRALEGALQVDPRALKGAILVDQAYSPVSDGARVVDVVREVVEVPVTEYVQEAYDVRTQAHIFGQCARSALTSCRAFGA
jgi:hypothetical protein